MLIEEDTLTSISHSIPNLQVSATPVTTFERFSDLPFETCDQIWGDAAEAIGPQVVEMYFERYVTGAVVSKLAAESDLTMLKIFLAVV